MKKILLSILTIGFFMSATSQVLTEICVPQYFSGRTAATAGNARVPVMVLVQVSGLLPNQSYDVKTGIALTTEANTSFGAGNYWGGSSFGTLVWANAFVTDSLGNSGPIWLYVQPTGNSTGGRFLPGVVHNLRYGFSPNGITMPATPTLVGTKTMIALDLAATPLTSATTDDGAYIFGTAGAASSGKYILAYDNVAGTGNPLAIYRVRSHAINQGSNNEHPTMINDLLMGTTNVAGTYALLIPIGANNANGVRRLETRNVDGSIDLTATDADGIWPSNANTTTVLRRGVVTITSTDAPLPIQYKSIAATRNAANNVIKWSTSTESNNKGFEVQRSVNGGKYLPIAFVTGAGNSNVTKNYVYTDFENNIGNVCYRLKQIDMNGVSELSKVVCVNIEATKTSNELVTSPNPFNGSLYIKYSSINEGVVTIQVIDMLGKTHQQVTESVLKGDNQVTLNTDALPLGIYFIRITNGSDVTTQRIVKR